MSDDPVGSNELFDEAMFDLPMLDPEWVRLTGQRRALGLLGAWADLDVIDNSDRGFGRYHHYWSELNLTEDDTHLLAAGLLAVAGRLLTKLSKSVISNKQATDTEDLNRAVQIEILRLVGIDIGVEDPASLQNPFEQGAPT